MFTGFFHDAIAAKELGRIARRWQTYITRVLYVGIVGVLLAGYWNWFSRWGAIGTVSSVAEFGRAIFAPFVAAQLTFATLLAVVSGADMVAREVRRDTLGLLVLTTLSPLGIALGKWKASMALTGTIILCGVPVMAICVYLGAVGPWELMATASLTVATASLGAALSILFSATRRSPLVAALMCALSIVGGSLVLLLMVAGMGESDLWGLAFIHPVAALGFGCDHSFSSPLAWAWAVATLTWLLLTRLVLAGAAGAIGRQAVIPRHVSALEEIQAREAYAANAASNLGITLRPRKVSDAHPLLWKEIVMRPAARMPQELRYAVIMILGLMLLLSLSLSPGERQAFQWVALPVFIFVAALAGASTFAFERENGNWDVLLSTPLTARQIVSAKLLAGLIAHEGLIMLGLILFSIVLWGWDWGGVGILAAAMILLPFLAFCYLLGAVVSLHIGAVARAFIITAAGILFLLIGLPLLSNALGDPGAASPGALRLLAQALNPFGLLADTFGVRVSLERPESGMPLLSLGIYGVASCLLGANLFRRFDRSLGRH